ncbi:MAG: transposase [Thermomicrobiales bacterium]|nr:transposase [Thermomicrobiales bacterium]
MADETTVREYPPLRAGWSRRGEPARVVISGRNAQRVIHGALNTASGEVVALVRARSRTAEVIDTVAALGRLRPEVPKLLIWDNAPAHHPKRVATAAWAAGIDLAFLPFRSPELMPLEDLWRGMKATVAANRCYETVDEAAARCVAWVTELSSEERLRRCGLRSSKFQWLPT